MKLIITEEGKPSLSDRLLDFKTIAEYLGVSKRQVYRLIAQGALPQAVKVGRSSKLFVSDIISYKEQLIRASRNQFGTLMHEKETV